MLLKKKNKIIVIFIFCVVLYLLKLIISKYISPSVKSSYEFNFKNFLIFTFLVSLIVYFIKFVIIYGVVKTSFFIFEIKSKISLFSVIVLAELLKLVIIDGIKIYNFLSLDGKMTLEQFKSIESNYSLYNTLNLDIIEFKYLINFISIFDLIFIYAIILLFSIYEKFNIKKSLKVIFLPYALALFFLAMVKTFMSL